MSDVVIQVEHIWKEYQLGVITHRTLTRDLQSWWARVRGKEDPNAPIYETKTQHGDNNHFWALQDISFEVKQGETLGIIGRNGAGKSTLLKILSQVTAPTKGEVHYKGRIASLLEVGTGFHPELTGRENIFLNGAILGMSKVYIRNKLDEIIAFAEIDKFIDTPVKRYSSGMYVRLAFAVAAHLEPEILIVDEVLAVGDAQFQKKCLGKMEEVGKEGRTVLFVSHNMDAIDRLCRRVIWLANGNVVKHCGTVSEQIKEYLYGCERSEQNTIWINKNVYPPNPYFDLRLVRLVDSTGKLAPSICANDSEISVEVVADIAESDKCLNVGYAIYTEDGKVVYWSCFTDTPESEWPELSRGTNRLVSKLPRRFLNEGVYFIEVMASLHNRQWIIEPGRLINTITFRISGGLSDSPFWYSGRPGVVAPVLPWERRLD